VAKLRRRHGPGKGAAGSSYAIPTKDHNLYTLDPREIKVYVREFLDFADSPPGRKLQFFVTRIGCGLAGYKDEDIAPMFKGAGKNVELPLGWRELAEK
jgi:hypothetical protein